MNRIKSIKAFVIVLIIGAMSMQMDWVTSRWGGESAADAEMYIIIIPFVITVALSIVGLIKNKVINIVMDSLCIVVSLFMCFVMATFVIAAADTPGENLGTGAILMIILAIGAVVISILSIKASINMDKTMINDATVKQSSFCINCGAKLKDAQSICNCLVAQSNEVEKDINKSNFTEIALDNKDMEAELAVDLNIENAKLEEVNMEDTKVEDIKVSDINIENIEVESKGESMGNNKNSKQSISVFCTGCGAKLDAGVKFCINCGTRIEEETSDVSQVNVENTNRPAVENPVIAVKKSNPKKTKAIVIAVVIIVAIIGGILGINKYKSENVSKKVIKEDLIGSRVSVGYLNIELTSENIKSIKLNEKTLSTELRMRIYDNDGTLVIEDEGYKVEVPFDVSYMYVPRSKNWELGINDIKTNSKDTVVEIKEKITEEIIKTALVGQEVG